MWILCDACNGGVRLLSDLVSPCSVVQILCFDDLPLSFCVYSPIDSVELFTLVLFPFCLLIGRFSSFRCCLQEYTVPRKMTSVRNQPLCPPSAIGSETCRVQGNEGGPISASSSQKLEAEKRKKEKRNKERKTRSNAAKPGKGIVVALILLYQPQAQ